LGGKLVQIIVNPQAGKGKAQNAASAISAILTDKNIAHKIHETKYAGHAKEIIQACVNNGETAAVYAIGGDGTVHEAAGGLAYSGIPFGLVPVGSGNDFARSLKGYKNVSAEELAGRFITGKTETIDLIRVQSGDSVYYCANAATLGLDAEIVKNADRLKPRFGSFAYLAITPSTIINYKKKKMEITADGTVTEGFITLMTACNGRVYGGGYKIAPKAKIDDGKITLCLITEMSKPSMCLLFPSVLMGLHGALKTVSFTDCEKVTAAFGETLDLNIDGNIYPASDTVSFEIAKGALTVFV